MKSLALAIILVMFSNSSQAQIGVQRALGSSYEDYQKYLEATRNQSFVRSYLELSKNINLETAPVSKCLDSLFMGKKSDELCFEAIQELTSQPLNENSREVVLSFLKKLKKFPSKYQKVYSEFEKGFAITHPRLAVQLNTTQNSAKQTSDFSKLEVNAWRRLVQKRLMLSETVLLINGEPIKNLNSWLPSPGVYQWALISNTHEPVIKISSFSQFASESIQDLKSFSNKTCGTEQDKEIKTYGLKDVQLFFSRKCILVKNMMSLKKKQSHLGDVPANIKITSPHNKIHWLIPAIAVIGVGIASQMKDKSVSISF